MAAARGEEDRTEVERYGSKRRPLLDCTRLERCGCWGKVDTVCPSSVSSVKSISAECLRLIVSSSSAIDGRRRFARIAASYKCGTKSVEEEEEEVCRGRESAIASNVGVRGASASARERLVEPYLVKI